MKGKIKYKQIYQYTINQLKAAHGIGEPVDDAVSVGGTRRGQVQLPLLINLQFNFYDLITIMKAKLEGYEFIEDSCLSYRPKVADTLIAKMELKGDRPFVVLLKEVESYIVANLATLDPSAIRFMPEMLFLPLPKSAREYCDNLNVNAKALANDDQVLGLLDRLPSVFPCLFAELIVYEPLNDEEMKRTHEYSQFITNKVSRFVRCIQEEVLNILFEKLEKDFATEESRRMLLQKSGDFLAGIIILELLSKYSREDMLTKLFKKCDKVGLLDGLFDKVIIVFSGATKQLLTEDSIAGAKRISRCLNEHDKRLSLLAFLGNKPDGIETILELIKLDIIPAYQLKALELCSIAEKLDKLVLEDDFKTKYYDANPEFFVACTKHFVKCVESNSCNNLVKFMIEQQPQLGEKVGSIDISADCAALISHVAALPSNTQLSTTALTLGSEAVAITYETSLPTPKYSEGLGSSQSSMYNGM